MRVAEDDEVSPREPTAKSRQPTFLRSRIVDHADPQPGEVYVINDPFTGGTHLPDITLVSRVPGGLACSRAHHADVGGMEPASLPAGSTDIYQEGLVLPPVRLDDELLTVLGR